MTSGVQDAASAYDELTGLPGSAGLELLADQMIARSARKGEEITLACFKLVAAWETGPSSARAVRRDANLVEVGRLFRSNLRASDVVGRSGLNEISVLFPDTGRDGALRVIEHFTKLVSQEQQFFINPVTAEVGFAIFEPSSSRRDLNAMLDMARLDMSYSNLRWSKLGLRSE